MDKLEQAKRIIKEHIEDADCGIFDTRNVAGDKMETIYCEDGLQVDICYYWAYFEVFGLSEEEFAELEKYYSELVGGML